MIKVIYFTYVNVNLIYLLNMRLRNLEMITLMYYDMRVLICL